ncbi:MFS transporter, partial [Kitasatospora herbaricolor]|uniref:MFS transporter n=1 Tax=Kitasatospora herbaricolor TaxID=68217 RepID=UPI0036DA3CD0
SLVSILVLVVLGGTSLFWLAIVFLVIWGFVFAVAGPVRQAYLNDMIPSKQRATVLSFDSLFGSLGGVFIQPALGRAADLWGYGTSLVIGGAVELIGIPFLFASRRQKDPADTNTVQTEAAPVEPGDAAQAGPDAR